MSKLQELEKKVARLYAKLNPLLEEIKIEKTKIMLVCFKCKRRNQVGKLTYLQTHWYTEPHGCTGGDYWSSGEGQYICPKCRHVNRLYTASYYSKEKNKEIQRILDLQYSFKETKDIYDDR